MKRLAVLLIAGTAFAAAPAEARMSRAVLFSTSPALEAELGDDGSFGGWTPVAAQPGIVERFLEAFSRTGDRPARPARNDITATLEAMQFARVGFSRRPNAVTPRRCELPTE